MTGGTDGPPRRAGWPDSATRPLVSPLQPSVVYAAEGPGMLDDIYEGRRQGYSYAREGHPNADVLAGLIDRLEGVAGGMITGSGMAAVSAALLSVLRAGDHVVGSTRLYGRSQRLLQEHLPQSGIEVTLADPVDGEALAAQIRPSTRLVLIETVSNPTLRVADVGTIAAAARAEGALLAVDNTFTTPRGFRPFEHGADIVIHSVTKLLAGHSDVTLGYVAAREPRIADAIAGTIASFGFTPSPFDCWLAERGLYTFELRYDRAEANAASLADRLAGAPGVRRVLYPGRPDHPDHERARTLFGERGGNMVGFEIAGGRAAAERVVRAMPGIALAPTLGDVSTTLSHPASSSHRALDEAARRQAGICEGLFRVSVGVEDADAIAAEIARAVSAGVS